MDNRYPAAAFLQAALILVAVVLIIVGLGNSLYTLMNSRPNVGHLYSLVPLCAGVLLLGVNMIIKLLIDIEENQREKQ